MEKKRIIDSECRKFKDQWNIQYFVIESSNKALSLICNESIAVLKEYNMKRHYETKHSQNYSKYTGIVRTEKFEALKRGLKSQQSLFTKVKTEQEAATRASFRVALEIAKRGKPFIDGEMIKECIIAVVEEMCPEKVLIYIRGVDKSYEVHEELLDMYSIHGTTTEIGETDLPYHTAVRWLSCGKVLQRFFELRAVIEIFLNEKHRPLTELQNNAWLWKLAFYVDLTKHVNELNLRLQGENQHLPDLYTNIKSFRIKLILFQSQLRSKCFSHFKTCEIFSHTTETEFPIDFAIETLSALKINFDTRFSDFDAIANQIKVFQNPFDADIETLAPELQMEMIDLQCSDIIKNKYENSSLLEFYKSLPLTQFDNLHKFARGLFSVFGTTYLCEKTFFKMNKFRMKGEMRSRAVRRTTISKMIKKVEAELDEDTPSERFIRVNYRIMEENMVTIQDEDRLIWELMLDDEENDDKWIDLETKINHFLNSLMKNTEALHGASSEKGSLPGTRVCRLPKLDLKIYDGSSLEFRMSEKPMVVEVTLMKGVDPASIKEDAGIVVSSEQMVEETSTQIAVEESEKAQVERKCFAEESKRAQVEKRSVVEVYESHRAEVKKESIEADEEKGLDVEQGMDSKNTEEVKLLYAEQGTDSKMAEGLDAGQGGLSLKRYSGRRPSLLKRIPEVGIKFRENKFGVLTILIKCPVPQNPEEKEIVEYDDAKVGERKTLSKQGCTIQITYVKREPIEKGSIGKYLPNNKMQLVSKETVSRAVITPILYTPASSPKGQVPTPEKNLNLGDKSPEKSGKSAKLERIANPVDYRNIILSGLRSLKKISESYDCSKPADDTSGPSNDTSEPSDDTSGPSDDTSGPSDDTSKSSDDTSKPSKDTSKPADDASASDPDSLKGKAQGSQEVPEIAVESLTKSLQLKILNLQSLLMWRSLEKTSATTTSEMLSFIAKLEDPLRWLAPVFVTGKIMVQRLWITELHWDDPMDESLIETWTNIRKELNFIGSLRIPRWLGLGRNTQGVKLHGFGDASEDAYAAAVYIRIPTDYGVKLCTTLLLTRLVKYMMEELNIKLESATCWSDSTIVMSWLRTMSRNLPTFIGSRVAEIQSCPQVREWRNVPTGDNSADIASRGILGSELK
ncbi:EPM2AIP1 [Cordylochernes scorpioides]|uniref:EPM2AIP1 n=1 Tax=Cordylochernes scorpioides TaxID=51811 RepID=A0ABY6LLY5_9ARAC|nr:EPM2AIP1 [Cordylochernes scorpioides]